MKRQWMHTTVLIKRLAIVLALFVICRICFYLFNSDLFPYLQFNELVAAAFIGVQYDIAAVLIINSLFILFHILPHPWREKGRFQKFLRIKYYIVNGGFLLLEAGDFIYFRYASERTSSHLLGLRHDIVNLIPQFFLDFWYVLLAVGGIFFLVDWLYKRTSIRLPHNNLTTTVFVAAFVFIVFGYPTFLLQGERTEALLPDDQASYLLDASELPLVTNTTYTVIESFWNRQLKPRQYLDEDKVDQVVQVTGKQPVTSPVGQALRGEGQPNVMVIMLESFSSEYIGYFNDGKGHTPFLDSLLGQSIVFENAYANGKHSIDAVTSITMGLPSLMTDPFISSPYFDNDFRSLAHHMSSMGYSTQFFHGAMNRTMQLNKFLPRAGFDKFYGLSDYGRLADYDGSWGIFDEPFLQYTAHQLDTVQKPFCNVLFTLTSHHPFAIPPQYKDRFGEPEQPIHQTVQYTDYALKQFFATASKKEWYDNTVFIITADHTGPAFKDDYKTRLGVFDIPMAIYKPNTDLSYHSNKVVQQTDIVPTVLDICGFEGTFTSFGNSMLRDDSGYSVSAMNGIYQIVQDEHILLFNGNETVGFYHIPSDPLLQENLKRRESEMKQKMEQKIKAIIQQYNNRMIRDKLVQ